MKLFRTLALQVSLLSLGTLAALAGTFTGDITAINPNAGQYGSFTVRSDDNKIKIFVLPYRPHLAVGQHVAVRYRDNNKFPLETTSVETGAPGGDFPGGS